MTNALVSTNSSGSSSSSTSSSSVLRITGMASGIDTDAVVKSMVSSYQTKIDKANQAQQTLQWKQDAYRDIIKGVKGLQEYFDPLSSKYILSGNTMNINSTTNSDSSKFSATASSSAKTGTYSVTTTQLATQAKVNGTSLSSLVPVVSTDITKWSQANLKIGSTNVQLDTIASGATLDKVVASINSKIAANTTLNGKVSASCVTDSNGSYIKFTNTSGTTMGLTVQTSGSSPTTLGSITSINSGISSSTKLSDLGISSGVSFSLSYDSKTTTTPVSITASSTDTLQNLMDKVNSATSGAVALTIDDTTGKISFQSKAYGSASGINVVDTSGVVSKLGIATTNSTGTVKSGLSSTSTLVSDLGFSAGPINFTLTNGATNSTVSLAVDSTTTFGDLAKQVNTATSGAVTLSMDSSTGKISFSSSSAVNLTDTSTSNNVITQLGIVPTTAGTGTDAIVSITAPGQATVTTTQSSNRFTSNGVTYSLVNTGTATTTVASNTDTVVSNIKSFITDYNTIISTINTKLTEKKNSAYPPLTDAQKASMSDTQISAWEAKAKVGILRNDDNLSSMMTQLRGIFSSAVYSNYDSSNSSSNAKISLSFGKYGTGAIGIDTSSDYTDGGKLVLQDESKLRDAITNNFDDFKKLFIGTSSKKLSSNQSYVGSSKSKEDGLFTRMSNILSDYVATPGLGADGTYTLAGSMNLFVNKQYDFSSTGYSGKNTIPDQIYKQTVSITNLKTQMSAAETRYYNKFSALESLMTKLSSQQSTLSSMLG